MVLEIPMPRSLPCFFDSTLRLSKPATSASLSAISMLFSNSPQSYVKVRLVLYGIASGAM